MESTWVGLYTHKGRPDLLPRQERLLLNVAEMWPCCIFQTLTGHHLDKYLPNHYEKPWAGCHLNIALPLLQPFSVKEKAEAEVLQSQGSFAEYVAANPDDREWVTDLSSAFHALRDAPDPRYSASLYHKERLGESLKAAHDATQQKAIESMRQYLSGNERAVDVFTTTSAAGFSWDRTSFTCGQFQFTISVDFNLHLKKGDKVFVQFHLADNVHPLKYTANALPTDPASRLAISLTGRDSTSEFHIWLTTSGPKAIKRMNTLVDILEGYSYSERQEMALPGRWWGHWRAEGSTNIQQHYT
ncbi:hypothetical protein ASPVEDRAFT_83160 [Aspergillus versicolor CBS 583.65]|uniref:Uncharacterized protein n=1 Tax=Aspergillus versicolor CBS 583.65 TaxID=1036611 RepID=A0A1L9PJG8_ASPVE|nr:uncharacterized protein ASPVEDRAFT_83160 [Aspergillus versicolor CBS 583.65]OJJ01631.1 hypothetical protein ASPVEDRAFT_83160 [Aspergillus versicolor CBS 583.65]